MYGKIIDGVFHEAPETYTFGNGFTVTNFNNDITLLTEMGYKEVVKFDAPIDTRFKYIFTYEEKDGKIFENRKLDTNEELLDDLKVRRIEQTKKDLARYLEENPLVSSCKDGIEKKYTVTLEKQNQLTTVISDYLSLEIPLYWNAQGETSEEWTYDEICKLRKEMVAYVRPIVEYQRQLETKINEQVTQDTIYNLDCYFEKDKIDRFINK